MYLLDVNLWIALAFQAHVQHAAARRWFDSQPVGTCHFCRLAQIGFLRIASNPRMVGVTAVTIDAAWTLYDDLMADERVGFSNEPSGVEAELRSLSAGKQFSAKLWNDGYLAAFARATGLQVVSFDRDFLKFANARSVILSV